MALENCRLIVARALESSIIEKRRVDFGFMEWFVVRLKVKFKAGFGWTHTVCFAKTHAPSVLRRASITTSISLPRQIGFTPWQLNGGGVTFGKLDLRSLREVWGYHSMSGSEVAVKNKKGILADAFEF
jgi:hypothetical protein